MGVKQDLSQAGGPALLKEATMTTEKVDGGEAVLEAFRNLGVDYIISSPGSEWPSVWEALARQKTNEIDGPRYIDCWHETLAVTMAMGYTRVTGRLQAVLLHAGVGLLQGSLGIHGAYLAEIPMIVCSGESITYGEDPEFDPGSQWYRNLSVVGGPNRLVDPFVKWSSHVTSSHTLYETVSRAGELAQRVPKGPTYLDIPIEVMRPEWVPPARMTKPPGAPKVYSDASAVKHVAGLISKSAHPVIVAEGCGQDVAAFHNLVTLAERFAIPVVEVAPNYANFPKDHPLYMGSDLGRFMSTSDLFLLVGTRTPWYPPTQGPAQGNVVVIDENPIKEHLVYQALKADVYLEGDVASTLQMLLDATEATSDKADDRRSYWSAEHAKQQDSADSVVESVKNDSPIDPAWLCAALSEVMPDDTVYVEETITHRGAIFRHLGWNKPQTYFHPNGGLGQGLGMALGVKLAKPQQPVVALMGDGCFLYNPVTQSLGVSAAENIPIMIVVFNNGKYAAMQSSHLQFFPDGVAARTGIHHGVDIPGPNYAELVAPFGGHGERVEDPAELKPALERALAAVSQGQLALVDVVLSR
jgi:acetolactate synthase-1/2/3 large subunit